MSRVIFSALATAFAAATAALPTSALAGCYGCYTPPPAPCYTCYRQVVTPAQYRTVYDNVMVSPPRMYAQRIPAKFATVYVPRTVMVEPERTVGYTVPAQYAAVPRVEMVSPPQAYWAPVRPSCSTCN